eukprot:scaffold4439_cov134-Skeletonema_dohrnii-CCMP3373.AAC.9
MPAQVAYGCNPDWMASSHYFSPTMINIHSSSSWWWRDESMLRRIHVELSHLTLMSTVCYSM